MEFEWDEAKRLSNIEKHGLDFFGLHTLFSGPIIEVTAKEVKGESRWAATGLIDGLFLTVVFTRRGGVIRVISYRRARNGEKARHKALHERGA